MLFETTPFAPDPSDEQKKPSRAHVKPAKELLSRLRDHHEPTYKHSLRVGKLAAAIAAHLGHDDIIVKRSQIIGMLHDVGKLLMPVELLDAPRALQPREWKQMQQHPLETLHLLEKHRALKQFAHEAASHHERINGDGYPFRLKGGAILTTTRIVTVADLFDAMTNRRPYHSVDPSPIALHTIRENAGTWWDPDAVSALEVIVRSGPFVKGG